jgi:transcriptional regulator with XRE-family HTH domain
MPERDEDDKLTPQKLFSRELTRRRCRPPVMSFRELGKVIGYDFAYLNRVEKGSQPPSEKLAMSLDKAYDTGGTFLDYVEAMKQGSTEEYTRRGTEFEAKAEHIRVFTSSDIPVLLQTEDYARARILSEKPKEPVEKIDAQVERRMKRKGIFLREEPPPYWAIIDESALRRPVGSHKAMAAQLDALLKAAKRPNVTIRVVTFDAGGYWMMGGSLTLLTSPQGVTRAYVESFAPGELVESTKRVVDLVQHFERVCSIELTEEASLEMIARYKERFERT